MGFGYGDKNSAVWFGDEEGVGYFCSFFFCFL